MLGFVKSFFVKKRWKPGGEIVVDISELAPIWLKYNQSFVPPELDDEESESGPKSMDKSQSEERESEKKSTVSTAPGFFGQEVVREFYDPYRPIFESQKASEGFLKLLEFLDRHGVCPSIAVTKSDSEADELYTVSEILEKITLREHSVNVARVMLKLLKETYRDYEELIPMALLVSFGHDIGKAPILRESGLYTKSDHPVLSETKLRELFRGKEPHWFEKVIEIVKEHHGHTKEPFGLLFMKADSRAREMEIASFSDELSLKEWDEWFDVKRFLEIVFPEINILKGQNKWSAVSHGSYVYLQPDLVYDSARKLCFEKKVVDMSLMKVSSKQEAIKKAVESLRKARILSPDLGDTKWGRWYEVRSQWFAKKMFLIPVKIDAFGTLPHVIEGRKEGYLEAIEKVSLTER